MLLLLRALLLACPKKRLSSNIQFFKLLPCPSCRAIDCAYEQSSRKQTAQLWSVPMSVSYWMTFAPSVLDNYALRHLLGRQGHCLHDLSGKASAFSR